VRALAVAPAGATTTGTTYDFAAATATPHFFCTDIGLRGADRLHLYRRRDV